MQQTKSYWRFVALAGVVTAFVASACVVTTSTDENAAGAAGSNTSAGATAAAGAGGASAGAGGTATAGTSAGGAGGAAAGAGGTAVAYLCDVANGGAAPGTPNTCEPADTTDVCQVCIKAHCCTEWGACFATSPGNQCGWGGPMDGSEILCVQECIKKGVMDTGVYDATLVGTCANECTTETTHGSSHDCGGVIGQQTSELVACIGDSCQTECFGG